LIRCTVARSVAGPCRKLAGVRPRISSIVQPVSRVYAPLTHSISRCALVIKTSTLVFSITSCSSRRRRSISGVTSIMTGGGASAGASGAAGAACADSRGAAVPSPVRAPSAPMRRAS